MQYAGSVRGSHATFLAARLSAGHVDALAVGDCCLFHLRVDGRVNCFPLGPGDVFGTSPDLISSNARQSNVDPIVQRYREQLDDGDVILAATDALAEWLTRNIGDADVRRLMMRIGNGGFQQLCIDLRARGEMKNDDVTLFRAHRSPSQGVRP